MLVEARRSRVQPAEAITARAYVQHRLYLAVDKELVTKNSVCIKQIEFQQSCHVIEDLVVEDHVNVETGEWILSITEARQSESRVFVTSIEFIEENVGPGEAFVSILCGVIDAVVVIPQRMHCFLDVADSGMRRVYTGIHVGIVMVVELSSFHKETRKSIALERRVAVVQVFCN